MREVFSDALYAIKENKKHEPSYGERYKHGERFIAWNSNTTDFLIS